MNYKPDESVLMAYLYDELEDSEKEMVQVYFQEHPEELKKFQEMASVLKMMGAVVDKEVIAPPVFADHEDVSSRFWKSASFKTVMSIAASFLLLLVAGKLLGPEIHVGNGELKISFGEHRPVAPVTTLTEASVQRMIRSSWSDHSKNMDARWAEKQQDLEASIHKSLDQNSRKVDALLKNASQASQDQLRSYVAGLQTENLRLMKDYFQLSAKEQNDYVEKLMIGFSKYMQEQRTQDLILVQNKMEDLEKNSDQFKMETEQLLTSIISNTKKKNSY